MILGRQRDENWKAWEQALDRLEQEVVIAEQVIEQADEPQGGRWQAPTVLGTIPQGLVTRAEQIQERQVAVKLRLQAAMVENRRQRQVTDKVAAQIPARRPVYLDTKA